MTLDCKIFSSHHALLETVYIIYPKSTINRVESAGILAESVGFWHAVAARGNSILHRVITSLLFIDLNLD